MILHGREVEIEVTDIEPFINDQYMGFKILWCGSIGWGEYTIYKHVGENKWYGDSEHMDKGDEKDFLELLIQQLPKLIEVIG